MLATRSRTAVYGLLARPMACFGVQSRYYRHRGCCFRSQNWHVRARVPVIAQVAEAVATLVKDFAAVICAAVISPVISPL